MRPPRRRLSSPVRCQQLRPINTARRPFCGTTLANCTHRMKNSAVVLSPVSILLSTKCTCTVVSFAPEHLVVTSPNSRALSSGCASCRFASTLSCAFPVALPLVTLEYCSVTLSWMSSCATSERVVPHLCSLRNCPNPAAYSPPFLAHAAPSPVCAVPAAAPRR